MMTNKEAVEKLRENFCKLKLFCELYPDACQKEDCDIYLAIEVLKGKDTVSPSIDTISRQAAIDAIEEAKTAKSEDGEIYVAKYNAEMNITLLPSAQPEPLTDSEQRLFLSAMAREEKVCKQVDDDFRYCREPYDEPLVRACKEIVRKVKDVLWTN